MSHWGRQKNVNIKCRKPKHHRNKICPKMPHANDLLQLDPEEGQYSEREGRKGHAR